MQQRQRQGQHAGPEYQFIEQIRISEWIKGVPGEEMERVVQEAILTPPDAPDAVNWVNCR